MTTPAIIRTIISKFPAVQSALSMRARFLANIDADGDGIKSQEDFLSRIQWLIRAAYNGDIAGEFIDGMAAAISRQYFLAYREVLAEEGLEMDDEFRQHVEQMIADEFMHVEQLFRDIVDARIDGTPIDPLLARAQLWANRYAEVQNEARLAIGLRFGYNMVWTMGATEEHCPTCSALNGIVAFASEWDTAGLEPQNAPNDLLKCGGWNCDCSLTKTDKRRSPNALDSLLNVGMSANL
jgi:hypothetical protein